MSRVAALTLVLLGLVGCLPRQSKPQIFKSPPEWRRSEESARWFTVDPAAASVSNEEIVRGGCSNPTPVGSGATALPLQRGHVLETTRYTFIVQFVVSAGGEIERFQILVGPDDPTTAASIRSVLETWHYSACIVNGEAHAFYRTAQLVHESS